MIKKLYTEITEEYQLNKLENEGDLNFSDLTHTPDMTEQDEVIKNQLKANLAYRNIFSYKFYDFWKTTTFAPAYCCCCRSKPTRNYRLYEKANKKLNQEFDVLRIVNLLRT